MMNTQTIYQDDTFDYATDDAVDTSKSQNQTESDTMSQFKDINSIEENKTSQRPLASHLVSSLQIYLPEAIVISSINTDPMY